MVWLVYIYQTDFQKSYSHSFTLTNQILTKYASIKRPHTTPTYEFLYPNSEGLMEKVCD
jgi:hypothetical protein